MALRLVFRIEQAFRFGGVPLAQALLLMHLFGFDMPNAAGPAEQSKFVSHVVTHVDEAATSRIPSVSHEWDT